MDSGTPSAMNDRVGRYVVLDVIGQGGMGVVFAAYDPELDRRVAIKLLQERQVGRDRESLGRARMLREAQALARLSHRNVVAVHDVGVHEGRVFIAMELVEGMTLDAWVENTRPTWREVLAKYVEAGRGLAAAHAAGLVHRDFKPHNVLVGDDGRVRVTDFGLVRTTPEGLPSLGSVGSDRELDSLELDSIELTTGEVALSSTITRTGAQVGTPAYMAPEQFAGDAVDPRADQFSFCVALYEALYGHRPFRGKTAGAIARQVALGRVRSPPPGSFVPHALRRALLRGLSADPADRHPSMEALLAVLTRDPYRVLRRGALVVGPPAVLAAVLAVAGDEPTEACSRIGDKLTGVWDKARKQEIAARFEQTGMPYATPAWETVQTRVDALADAWVVAQAELCAAKQAELPEGFGHRVACLQRRFEELRSYSDLLAQADASLVEHAVETVDALGTVADCDATDYVGSQSSGETQKGIVAALAQARVNAQAARYDAAEDAALQALDLAQQADDRWLVAEATYELGRALEARGEHEEGKRRYHDAFNAGVAAKHHEVVMRAAMSVAVLTAEDEQDVESAENWLQHARAANERLGERGRAYLGQLDNVAGRLAQRRGDYEAARESFERALKLRAEYLGEDSTQLASYHINLGHALSALGRLDEAADQIRQGLVLEEREYGKTHPRVAQTHAALCGVLRDQGQQSDAIEACRRAVAVLRATLGDAHPRTGTALLNLGAALSDAGRHDEARVEFLAALDNARLAFGQRHRQVALALNNLAVHHELADELPAAERYAREALSVMEEAQGADHPMTLVIASNLANLVRKQGRYEEAEALLRRNVELLERRLGPDHPDVGLTLGMLAESIMDSGRTREALPILERALTIFEHAPGRAIELAAARFALGATLYELGEEQERGHALVEQAAQTLRDHGTAPDRLARVESWLAEH